MYFFNEIVTEAWSWPWWGVMVAVNIISVLVYLFVLVKMIIDYKKDKKNSKYRIALAVVGGIYVAVAMYRSIFVSSYTDQKAWFDSMANSMFVIRCLATFAEISFACLIGIPLLHMNKEIPLPENIANKNWLKKYLLASPWIIITCLSVAQFFAWSGLLTQYKVLFAIEETLWALGFTSVLPLVIIQLVNLYKNYKNDSTVRMYKAFGIVLATFTCGYLLFQYCYALPFDYYSKLADDFANTTHYPINGESFMRILKDFNPVRTYEGWGGIGFLIWHSGYFSVCVWMNILYAAGPRLLPEKVAKTK